MVGKAVGRRGGEVGDGAGRGADGEGERVICPSH